MKEPTPLSSIFSFPTLPQARDYNGLTFPLTVSPPSNRPELSFAASASHQYIATHRPTVETLLQRHSVLLLRGFGQATPHDFAKLVEHALALPNFPYVGGNAVRTSIVADRVFTTNESPPEKPIPFHHELAQTPSFPRRILFFCETPGDTGGETPVLYSPAVYDELKEREPEFIQRLEQVGLRYSRVMTRHDRPHSAIGRGWENTLNVSSKREVERVLANKGYGWEWLGGAEDKEDKLREISPVLNGVYRAEDGRRSFFNQMVAVWGGWRDELNEPEACIRFGDGGHVAPAVMEVVKRVMDTHRVSVPWQKGDVLYIDNMMAQHSRAPFTGKRKVLASLAADGAEVRT